MNTGRSQRYTTNGITSHEFRVPRGEEGTMSGDVEHASHGVSSRSIHLNVVFTQIWSLRVGEIRVLEGIGSGDALSGVEFEKALQEVDR